MLLADTAAADTWPARSGKTLNRDPRVPRQTGSAMLWLSRASEEPVQLHFAMLLHPGEVISDPHGEIVQEVAGYTGLIVPLAMKPVAADSHINCGFAHKLLIGRRDIEEDRVKRMLTSPRLAMCRGVRR